MGGQWAKLKCPTNKDSEQGDKQDAEQLDESYIAIERRTLDNQNGAYGSCSHANEHTGYDQNYIVERQGCITHVEPAPDNTTASYDQTDSTDGSSHTTTVDTASNYKTPRSRPRQLPPIPINKCGQTSSNSLSDAQSLPPSGPREEPDPVTPNRPYSAEQSGQQQHTKKKRFTFKSLYERNNKTESPPKPKPGFSESADDTGCASSQLDKTSGDLRTYYEEKLDEKDKEIDQLLLQIQTLENQQWNQHNGHSGCKEQLYKKDKEIKRLLNQLQYADTPWETHPTVQRDMEMQLLKVRVQQLEKEKDDLTTRLSAAIGDKLLTNNPNIADLSDGNRPTKLSDKYTELYDNEWTDAYTALERAGQDKDIPKDFEKHVVRGLLKTLTITYEICYEFVQTRFCNLEKAYRDVFGANMDAEMEKRLKDQRKGSYKVIEEVKQAVDGGLHEFLTSEWELRVIENAAVILKPYLDKCLELCWAMAIQDPPVYMDCNVDIPPKSKRKFERDLFREYTKKGERVCYIVWPVLYLHKGGPVLCKGVAQGRNKKNKKGKETWEQNSAALDSNETMECIDPGQSTDTGTLISFPKASI